MDKTCRLCAQKSSYLTSVFKFHHDRLISDMIHIVCPIKIDISDNLPKSICKSCLKLVLDAIGLRERSVKSDLKLRSEQFEAENLLDIVKIDPFCSEDEHSIDDRHNLKKIKMDHEDEDKVEEEEEDEDDGQDDDSNDRLYYETAVSIYKGEAHFEPEDNGRLKCPICNKSFTLARNVRRHLHVAHHLPKRKLKGPEDVTCPFCKMVFTRHTNMRRHVKSKHEKEALESGWVWRKNGKSLKLAVKSVVSLSNSEIDGK